MNTDLSENNISAASLAGLIILVIIGFIHAPRTPHASTIAIHSNRINAAREYIDPNTASLPSLCRLPGIGPVIAGKIVEYRDMYGPFRSEKDLLYVHGFGPATLMKVERHLRIAQNRFANDGDKTGEPGDR